MERRSGVDNQKLSFQRELSEKLKERNKMQEPLQEESTSESEDDYDEYDDDFDEEDDLKSPTYHSSAAKSSNKSKSDDWNFPSFGKDSDSLQGGGSMYLKQSTKKTQNKNDFDPFGMGKKDSSRFIKGEQSSEESETNDYENDPIMQLLQTKPKSEKQPTPAKRRGSSKDQDDSFPQPQKSQTHALSPQPQQDRSVYNDKYKFDKHGGRSKSPVERVVSPKGRKSPFGESQRSPTFGSQSPELKGIITTMKSNDSHDPFGRGEQVKVKKTKEEKKSESFVDFLLEPTQPKADPTQPKAAPRKKGSSQDSYSKDSVQSSLSRSLSPTASKDRKEKERLQDEAKKYEETRRQRTLSGELGRSKSPLHRSMSPETEAKYFEESRKQKTLLGEKVARSKSPIHRSMSPETEAKYFEESRKQKTLLLEKARSKSPLHRSMSPDNEVRYSDDRRQKNLFGETGRSKSPSHHSMSPKPEMERKFDESRRQRTLSGEFGRSKSPVQRSMSPRPETQKLTSMPLPTLQSGRQLSTQAMIDPQDATNFQTSPKMTKAMMKTEKEKSHSDANDILAMFDQAVQNEPVDFQAKMEERRTVNVESPVAEVVQKTESQKMLEFQKQRSSRQLIDNVISNVAQHNDGTSDTGSLSGKEETKVKSPRTKSGKKSYRTPPTNYQGLGSLTMLEELKKGDDTSQKNTKKDVSTDDIRKKVYLEWLAKREEENKKKRKLEAEKKKEEDKKQKDEKEDKEKENAIVRMKWEEVKKEQDKEKARTKRKQEQQEERKKLEKEKQKLKSEKDAEKRRQQLLENAKIKHKAELRKKNEEDRKIKKEKQNQKKENEKAVEKWMDKRSEKWVDDRKKEEREKKKEQKKEREQKKIAAEEADEKYNTWREKKDNQLKATMRENKMAQRRQKYFSESDEENQRPPWSPANKVIPRRR